MSDYNQIKSLTQVKSMMIAVARHSPLITWVNAINFQNYVSGVYDASKSECDPKNLNHLFLIVGYGTDSSGTDYWLVKNSYGTSWGENGYMRIKRGSNVCGVETNPYYPIAVSSGIKLYSQISFLNINVLIFFNLVYFLFY